ncbi:MAG: hypothetical protein BAJALOKI3v1_1240003 [Promethearchaeota archaeon]|nr:MAG: hypothetical protein BAJALOKI3v1_1240003 [Candidatus Lokiarchaeota archaeon]
MKELFTPLQALAYWIGYQHEIYPFYHIPELAITSELSRLLSLSLSNSYVIKVEYDYKKICKNAPKSKRVDIYLEVRDNNNINNVAIEVKRYKPKQIIKDIDKMRYLKSTNLSKYMIITSEMKFPSDFVKTSNGKRSLDEKYNGCKVKRVLKASHSFSSKNCNYVILLEII